jgi:VanZ family protein
MAWCATRSAFEPGREPGIDDLVEDYLGATAPVAPARSSRWRRAIP